MRRATVRSARRYAIGSLFDLFTVTFREQWVVQKFLPAIKQGDKRIILVDGEIAGAINRVPAPDETRSNLHVGGTAEPSTPVARCAGLF